MNMKPVSSKQRGNRPDWYEYYINIAMAVRDRANCHGSKIGSILVLDNRILTTGYNGTPQDMQNCDEGGCDRCADRHDKKTTHPAPHWHPHQPHRYQA